jgi:hypothetical protein
MYNKNMNKGLPFNEEILKFISDVEWTYAKTYPKWPHEYIVRKKVDYNLFMKTVIHIRENGYDGTFYKMKIGYFDHDGYTYWTMGEPLEETDIINRCLKENTYESRLANGTLPEE